LPPQYVFVKTARLRGIRYLEQYQRPDEQTRGVILPEDAGTNKRSEESPSASGRSFALATQALAQRVAQDDSSGHRAVGVTVGSPKNNIIALAVG